jgi:Zn-dependent M28 family amino/carboxypeptidase
VAMMIEVAGRLAQAPRPARDVLVMATTSEEEGEIGAEYFATHPTVPLDRIVAAINLDTVAIAPAGEPVAILNRSVPALNAAVEATATALGRRMDTAHEADEMAERQDGYALARHGVPAIMVGGSFASMDRLGAFLNGRYHGPDDEADGTIEMGGATEDANLLVALVRRLGDPAAYADPRSGGQ